MTDYLVEVVLKKNIDDPLGKAVVKDAVDSGFGSIGNVRVGQLYLLSGDLAIGTVERIARDLLTDPVTQVYRVVAYPPADAGVLHGRRIDVWYHSCVTDTVGETVKIGIADLHVKEITRVSTGTSYIFSDSLADDALVSLAQGLLANGLIQKCTFY